MHASDRSARRVGNHRRTWQLTCSLLPYFGLINYGTEASLLLEHALSAARKAGNPIGETVCLMGLAHAHRVQGLSAKARELATEAIKLSRENNDQAREVSQRTGLGVMYLDENRFDEALACFSAGLELASRIGDQRAEANLTNNVGVIHRELGRFDDAVRYFRRTLVLDETSDMPQSQALTLANLGQIAFLQGHTTEATEMFGDALHLARASGTRHGEAVALTGLCTVLRLSRDHGQSLAHGREALEVARGSGVYDAEGDALNALGDTHVGLGDLSTAEQVFEQARAVAVSHDSARYIARAREGLAHVLAARGDLVSAGTEWRAALETYPGGVLDAAGARRHVSVPGATAGTCWRCDPGTRTPIGMDRAHGHSRKGPVLRRVPTDA